MPLTVRDAARALNVRENVLRRWVAEEGLPAHEVNGRLTFHRLELLEWVTAHKGTRNVSLSPELFQRAPRDPLCPLSTALQAGGIHRDVAGADRDSVLRELTRLLPLPAEADRELLFRVLEAREALGSTAVGDGIAIPHVRNPLVARVPRASLSLCFLRRPVDFRAPDDKPVDVVFFLVAPTIRTHLHLLSRLAGAIADPGLRAVLTRKGTAEEVLAEMRRIEGVLAGGPAQVRS